MYINMALVNKICIEYVYDIIKAIVILFSLERISSNETGKTSSRWRDDKL